MRIDQLPLVTSIENTDTLPANKSGVSVQVSVGDMANAIRSDVYGAPLAVSQAADMTDHTKVYVYTGTTTSSFTKGHWYFWNGSAWEDGGIYNSAAVQTDTTLTLSGVPADAKATGDAIKEATDAAREALTAVEEVQSDVTALETRVDDLEAYVRQMSPITTVGPASLVSIEDAAPLSAESLKVNVEPVQDLHGYDAPWPAGGGKNKLDITAASTTIAGINYTINADGTVTVNGTATATSVFILTNNLGEKLLAGNYILSGCPSGGSTNVRMDITRDAGAAIQDIGSGASFEVGGSSYTPNEARIVVLNGQTVNNWVFEPMIRLASETDATFSPYSNICPITGWNGVTVKDEGKNLLPITLDGLKSYFVGGSWSGNVYTVNGIDVTVMLDGDQNVTGIRLNGTASALTILNLTDYTGKFLSTDERYTISASGLGSGYYMQMRGMLNGQSSYTDMLYVTNTAPSTTMDIDASGYSVLYMRFVISNGASISNAVIKPMVRYASDTDATFAPYVPPRTASIDFGQTVYGGTVDLVTGECVVDRASKTVTSDDVKEVGTASSGLKWARLSQINGIVNNDNTLISDQYVYSDNASVDCSIRCTGVIIYIYDNRLVDLATAKSLLIGLQIVYSLASPLTLTLTPAELELFKGINNISADAGKVTVTYRQDIYTALNNKINELQAIVVENG